MTKHGHFINGKPSPTYKAWDGMLQRCTNINSDKYKGYGGRGIVVCEQWKDFRIFLKDLGIRPAGTSLDRINNSKGYEPSNCRWATAKEQALNRTTTTKLTMDDVTLSITEWADIFGIDRSTITKRLAAGWSVEKAISFKVRKQKKRNIDKYLS